MADTRELGQVVEPALLETFWQSRGAEPIPEPKRLRPHLHGMEIDGIAVHRSDRCLYLCEVTTSGYLGNGGKDFHVGAVRKLADAFARFSIVMHPLHRQAVLAAAERQSGATLRDIQCHLLVPTGSRFIRALGYRDRLFALGIMSLTEVMPTRAVEEVLRRVLGSASSEMA